jgi:hypothetical protein
MLALPPVPFPTLPRKEVEDKETFKEGVEVVHFIYKAPPSSPELLLTKELVEIASDDTCDPAIAPPHVLAELLRKEEEDMNRVLSKIMAPPRSLLAEFAINMEDEIMEVEFLAPLISTTAPPPVPAVLEIKLEL